MNALFELPSDSLLNLSDFFVLSLDVLLSSLSAFDVLDLDDFDELDAVVLESESSALAFAEDVSVLEDCAALEVCEAEVLLADLVLTAALALGLPLPSVGGTALVFTFSRQTTTAMMAAMISTQPRRLP